MVFSDTKPVNDGYFTTLLTAMGGIAQVRLNYKVGLP